MFSYEFQTRVSSVNTYQIKTEEPITEGEVFWEIQKYTEIAWLVDVAAEDEELQRGSFREC